MPLFSNPESTPDRPIEWGVFRMAMLSNAAYQRVSGATSVQRSVSRLESYFATEAENWAVARMFWQQMIAGCPQAALPSAEEVATWNQIATQANMPLGFNANGQMETRP